MPAETFAVHRWMVPVDGRDHTIDLSRYLTITAVGCLDVNTVEFWGVDPGKFKVPRTFTVLGTGHPIPNGYTYVGTAPRHDSGLVWHLFERASVPGPETTQED